MREELTAAVKNATTLAEQRRVARAAALIARAVYDACGVHDPTLSQLVELTDRWGRGEDVFTQIYGLRDAAVGLDDNDCAMCAAWFTDHEACVGADALANLEDLLDAAKELADARGVALTLPVEQIRELLTTS